MVKLTFLIKRSSLGSAIPVMEQKNKALLFLGT